MNNNVRYNIVYITTVLLCMVGIGCSDSSKAKARKEARRLQSIEIGRELYLDHGCAVCHGKNGHGDGITAKTFYPRPIDFHNPEAYVQGNKAQAISQSIKNGVRREGSAMPKYDHLSDKELRDISIYLESLQIPQQKEK